MPTGPACSIARGRLVARDGTLAFLRGAEPGEVLPSGEYGIPAQGISTILLGPDDQPRCAAASGPRQ